MKFEEIIPFLEKGAFARLPSWREGVYITLSEEDFFDENE